MRTVALFVRCLLLATLAMGTVCAARAPLGPFAAHADVGGPALAGSAGFDKGVLTVKAGGANMMGAYDEFHFVWRKVTGDFMLSARVAFTGPGAQDHRKAGLMARAGLGDDAAYVDVTVHGKGPRAVQARRAAGGQTDMVVVAPPGASAPQVVRLERRGGRFSVTIGPAGQPGIRREVADTGLPATLYVGMFLCAHDPASLESAVFDRMQLTHIRPTLNR